jgi:hypothetical protein
MVNWLAVPAAPTLGGTAAFWRQPEFLADL